MWPRPLHDLNTIPQSFPCLISPLTLPTPSHLSSPPLPPLISNHLLSPDLLNASIVAQRRALDAIKATGKPPEEFSLPFEELQRVCGFPDYYAEAERYKV